MTLVFTSEQIQRIKEALKPSVADLQELGNKINNLKPVSSDKKIFYQQPTFIQILKDLHRYLHEQVLTTPQKLAPELQLVGLNNTTIQLPKALSQLIDQLNGCADDEDQCKKIMINFGLQYRKDSDEEKYFGVYFGPQRFINELFKNSLNLNLYELDLALLEEQINRINKIKTNEKNHLQKDFVASLWKFHKKIKKDIEELSKDQRFEWQDPKYLTKKEIFNDSSFLFLQETIHTLSQLTYDPSHQSEDEATLLNYGRKYEKIMQETPRYKNFFKSLFAVILSGFGFITGLTIGTAAGVMYFGVGGGITGPVGGYFGGAIGKDLGKYMTGMSPKDSIFDHLMLRENSCGKLGTEVAQKAMQFINPNQPNPYRFYQPEKNKVVKIKTLEVAQSFKL